MKEREKIVLQAAIAGAAATGLCVWYFEVQSIWVSLGLWGILTACAAGAFQDQAIRDKLLDRLDKD